MPDLRYNKHQMENNIISLLQELEQNLDRSIEDLLRLIKKYQKTDGTHWSYAEIIEEYKKLAGTEGLQKFNPKLVEKILLKPVRTISGVAPVTVLTKPYPCPGKCIFCPNDLRMPKSYLASEPGAQRAEKNYFDPYLQTTNRLEALFSMGHKIDKVELIILGGTWTAYPEAYQIWFVKECFRALNDFQIKMIHKNYKKIPNFSKKIQKNSKKMADQAFFKYRCKENQAILLSCKITGEKISDTYNQLVAKYYLAPENVLGVLEYQKATGQN
jgi:histone acetyltransferase (RNA polymerase elongator complex component)